MTTTWQTTGSIKPETLTESRVQLHYAVQFIAAANAAFVAPQPDYSHTSLIWDAKLQSFAGYEIQAASPFRVVIDPVSLTLRLLDSQQETIAALPLAGNTRDAGLTWLKQELSQLGMDADGVSFLDYPPDDFPDHPLAHGGAFATPARAALQELAAYYANTDLLLQPIIASTEGASTLRIWPHHFDIATLIQLPSANPDTPLTIGVGLSPGDTSYPMPYWYISPYPYPPITDLPTLAGGGFWHTHHWVGAVLPASHLTTDSNGGQPQQVTTFVQSALQQAIDLLKIGI